MAKKSGCSHHLPAAVLLSVLILYLASFFTAIPARAQVENGINGTVTDASGAVIPGTQVTVSNNATGITAKGLTSSAGTFTLAGLNPGSYSVVVEAPAFKTIKTTLADPMETIGWLPTLRNNGLTAAYDYGHFLGNRYKSFPNIAWLSEQRLQLVEESGRRRLGAVIAKGIKSVDSVHLHTVELNVFTSSSLDDQTWRRSFP